MSIQAMIQDGTSVLNVVVLAVGYYFLVKLYREWIHQSREERKAGGRPMVVVAADYDHLPEVHIVVRNFTKAPAKEVTFGFSAPVESPGGAVLSELPYFQKGLPFLEPEEKIGCYWGSLPALLYLQKKKGLEEGIRVTTRYKDLAGESYASQWTLNPLLFDGAPLEASRGMDDLVRAVEEIPDGSAGREEKETGGEGGPMALREPTRRSVSGKGSLRRITAALLLLSVVFLGTAGCGGYSSQAGKYLTEARSQVLGSAFVLERFGEGEVSGPFLRASLEQYAIAMESTARSMSSLKPPPGATEEHRQEVEAVSRARSLVYEAGHTGIDPKRAPELAQKLRRITQELKEP